MTQFSLGCDPEVVAKDSNGNSRSVIGLIGGTKKNPRKTKHGSVQEDNVLAEFNTHPAFTRDEFITNVTNVLGDLEEIFKPLDLSVSIEATSIFSDEDLSHRDARVAGCDPDFDAWKMRINDKPSLNKVNFRSCGGHLHIAWDNADDSTKERANLVRVLDLVAGVPSVLMDENTTRRSLYGKAGCHRPKMLQLRDPYSGVEYRSLSNFWLKSSETIGWAWDVVDFAVKNYKELSTEVSAISDRIVTTINMSDVDEAQKIVDEFNLEVVYG